MCRSIMTGLLFSLIAVLCIPQAQASNKDKYTKRITRANTYLNDIMKSPDTEIPTGILEKAKGIIILRQYKAGFVIGVKGGAGIAMVRNDNGTWTPPAFVKTGEGSFGFQIGGQSIDSIFLIMNEDGMDMLKSTAFKIGVDASAAIGPVGRDAEAKFGVGVAILAYSRAKGLYAGASFEGGLLLQDKKANDKYYGKGPLDMNDIFSGKVSHTAHTLDLAKALSKYTREAAQKNSSEK